MKISEILRCVGLYMYKLLDVLFILFYNNNISEIKLVLHLQKKKKLFHED